MADAPFDEAAPHIIPHPRIRQRRLEVRRDEGRRRLRVVVTLAATVAVAASAYGVTRSPLLDVDRVKVRGAGQTDPADVVQTSGLDGHPSMIDLDERRVAARIERIPWVERAEVTRQWPGTVEVTLQERTPLAALPLASGQVAVVDQSGRVLQIRDGDAGELFRIDTAFAPGGEGTVVHRVNRAALSVVASMPELLASRVRALAVHQDGAIELRLDAKVTVLFGAARETKAKLVALTTVLQKTDLRRVRTIDVRVPTAPVLTRG